MESVWDKLGMNFLAMQVCVCVCEKQVEVMDGDFPTMNVRGKVAEKNLMSKIYFLYY